MLSVVKMLLKREVGGLSFGLNEMYVWFLLAYQPYFFNPTLNIKMVFGEFGEEYLKWALFQILSLFSLLNVTTKFNNFPTYLP